MSWKHQGLLWLLLLVPALTGVILWAWRRRQSATKRFGDPTTVTGLVVGRSPGLRAARAILWLTALGLIAITLAGPLYGSRTRVLRKRGLDVVVALDFSKSMLARDVKPSRIQRAKAELTNFVQELGGDRVGIVAFAGDTMEFPMTTDYSALQLFFRDLGPYDMPVGGTAIGRALTASKRLLDRAASSRTGGEKLEQRDRIIILLTDGEDHEGDPVAVATELKEASIRVYTVGIGSRSGEPVPVHSADGTWTGYMRDEDGNVVTSALSIEAENKLKKVASATGGKYFRAQKGGVGMNQIRAAMKGLKRAERKARRVTVQEERYAFALLPAFLLLVLEGLLPEGWIGRRRRRREHSS